MYTFITLLPSALFFLILLFIGFLLKRREAKKRRENFSKEYFIGGRSLNGFVLAMSLVATYGSVSSFVGGPGVAWRTGLAWVLFASVQVVAAYLILGIIGKKLAVIARRVDAITIIDVIRSRYPSDFCANLCAVVLLLFFTTQMIAQFIGGANIFAAVTGLSYQSGLLFFALVVVLYTTIGGFNTVAITDTICAILMLLGMFFLTYAILHDGHGWNQIMHSLHQTSQQGKIDLFSPTASNTVPIPLLASQWILCGIGTIGLPQSAVRCLSYKDTQSVHRAMLIGTIVCGAMMVGMPLLGFLAHSVILTLPPHTTTDAVIPLLIAKHMNPWLAGFTIIGPLAATMSTISSLLIAGSSAIVKDIYLHYKKKTNSPAEQKFISRIGIGVTAFMGICTVLLAIKPPSIIVWINLFAFGGLETAFFWILILGLFWHRANSCGAISAIIGGLSAYCLSTAFQIHLSTCHNIVIGIGAGAICFYIGSLLGKAPHIDIQKIFFPERF